ncbi:hypothetical protein [Paucisalibacillus sp. EB02]|uniref:hypothetical protein n=1 Tax=Paucisalibacillus sp. EB02 TaxID=1347087 RepID=UPI0004B3F0D2|nr:hypothetical protein [Paucisalibacillus sp. EB02]
MIIRKTITTILASVISMFFLLIVIFKEAIGIDFVNTLVFTIAMFSPVILLYGVPITFLSDYVTRRFAGVRRILSAFIFHLFFGMIFPILFCLLARISTSEAEIMFIGATTFAFFFWAIDEIARLVLKNNTVMNYDEPSSIKFKHWLYSFIVLLIISLVLFTINSFLEANRIGINYNWGGVIIANVLYSIVLALIFSPIGYLIVKTVSYKRNSKKV